MRISDWSSDVCSSDLPAAAVDLAADRTRRAAAVRRPAPGLLRARGLRPVQRPDPRPRLPRERHAFAAASAARRPAGPQARLRGAVARSEEHTSDLQSLMRISYAVFCLKKKQHNTP